MAVVWQVVGQDRLVAMEDRKDLPYIDAVITEILRVVTIGKSSLWSSLVHPVHTDRLVTIGKSSLWSPLVSPVTGHHW